MKDCFGHLTEAQEKEIARKIRVYFITMCAQVVRPPEKERKSGDGKLCPACFMAMLTDFIGYFGSGAGIDPETILLGTLKGLEEYYEGFTASVKATPNHEHLH
jgi:hypothetical protein